MDAEIRGGRQMKMSRTLRAESSLGDKEEMIIHCEGKGGGSRWKENGN